MIDRVCQILKGMAVIGWLCASQVEATTCTASTSTALQNCINSAACGDTINVLAGRYHAPTGPEKFQVLNKSCASPSLPITIQVNGWTSSGTGDQVFIDNTEAPNQTTTDCPAPSGSPLASCGWTQCTLATCGEFNFLGANIGQVWYTPVTGAIANAQKPDGSPTFPVATAAEVTNAHSATAYLGTRCASEQWRRCDPNLPSRGVNVDCPASGDTCTGTSPEIDSYRNFSTGNLYVRWGTGVNAPGGSSNLRPFIYQQEGTAFDVENSQGIIIHGFTMRGGVKPGIIFRTPDSDHTHESSEVVTQDNQIFYRMGGPFGSGTGAIYGIQVYHAASASISDSEIAYSADEGIHTDPRYLNAAMNFDVSNTWIHNIGDARVMGNQGSTPSCVIWAGCGPTSTPACSPAMGNYTGSVFNGNLLERCYHNGLDIETQNTGGSIISNNIVALAPYGTTNLYHTLKIDNDQAGTSIDSLQIFNNIWIPNSMPRFQCTVFYASSGTITNTSFYNNTIISDFKGICACDTCTGITSNLHRNNIFYSKEPGGTYPAIEWGLSSTTNKFQNNLIYSLNPQPIRFGGASYSSCGAFDTAQPVAGGSNVCAGPGFVDASANNFHLAAGSPAIDHGTATGMPAGRISINNSLASLHGFPDYADGNDIQNGTWDIGVDEYLTPVTNLLLDCQDPTFEQCAFVGGGTSTETSPCDEPIGGEFNGGETTIVNDPALAHSGNCFAKMRQFTFLDTCTPPALPGLKWDVSGLIVGNQYQVNGFVNFPTTIATQIGSFYLLMCTDVTGLCSPENPLGLAGLAQIGVCSGGTRNGLPCDEPANNVVGQCPGGGTCNPVPGYQPFSFVFQATATTQTLRFFALSSERQIDAAHPRYLYIDDISVIPRP